MPGSSTNLRHFIIITVLIVLSTVIMTWLLRVMLPLPMEASTQAATVDYVFNWNMFLIALFFSLVMVFMLYAVFAFRRRDDDESEGEHFEGNSVLEIVWTVVPLVIVIFLAILGVTTLNEITQAQDNELVVNVEGFQWGWTFSYPEEGDMISAEMVLPVDRPARMEMTSKDVIHSFWIPEFRVKQDLVPGQITVLRFTPSEVGDYELRCAEICGLSHWSMIANVRVVEQEEYDAWISEQTAGSSPALANALLDAPVAGVTVVGVQETE